MRASLACAVLAIVGFSAPRPQTLPSPRLYVLDCGTLAGRNLRTYGTLRSQLAEIGVEPASITYLAISHMHADHTGNASDYAGSTWLVQEAEREFAFKDGQNTASYRELADGRATVLHGDHDVFGDGVATLVSTPGHTPGHQSLLVKLPHTGAILLTGDLYHYPEERSAKTFPSFEMDRAKTAASRERVESLVEGARAEIWIEHDLLL